MSLGARNAAGKVDCRLRCKWRSGVLFPWPCGLGDDADDADDADDVDRVDRGEGGDDVDRGDGGDSGDRGDLGDGGGGQVGQTVTRATAAYDNYSANVLVTLDALTGPASDELKGEDEEAEKGIFIVILGHLLLPCAKLR